MTECYSLYAGSYASNCYQIISSDKRHCAIIDPSCPPSMAKELPCGAEYDFIFLTHCHFDHMIFYDEWRKFAKCPVYAGAFDLDGFNDSMYNAYSFFYIGTRTYDLPDKLLYGGEKISFGHDIIDVISTPGHTAGSISYKIGNMLFCGDTLFDGGVYGRTDLMSGSEKDIMRSLSVIRSLGQGTVCYPGHGPSFTL